MLCVFWFNCRRQLYQNIFFGLTTFLCFFFIGHVNYLLQLPNSQPKHYSHIISVSKPVLLKLKIKKVLKSDLYNLKYISEVQAVNEKSTSGKLLVSVQKDSLAKTYTIDNELVVWAEIKEIPKPLNPNQFDYSKYMKTLSVYSQIRASEKHILTTKPGRTTIRGGAEKIRNFLLKKLQKTTLELDERAIVQALVLGQKNEISKDLYSDYIAAGAVHILAVSGLHVGILYFIFAFLLKPLKQLPNGGIFHGLALVIGLWGFAFITGLSPSVTRAVTMFSFFAFAKSINRDSNSLNTLSLSFFALLLVNPLWLFHVGFQLSYLAVLSILLIQPSIRKLYRPRFYLDKLFWNIFTVSLAAQLGVLPLSLYYFHQFPGLFFITNLVVLPVLGILLGVGVLIVCLASIDWLPEWLANSYNFLISTLNKFINWVANQDRFLFEDIHFSEGKLLGSYLFIVSLMFLWKISSPRKLIFSLASFGLLIGLFIWDKYDASGTELIVFQKSRKSLIGFKKGSQLVVFRSDSETYKRAFPIKGYLVGQQIDDFSEENIPPIFNYNQQTILVIDSSSVYPNRLKKAVVILTQSPKVNLERLIDSLSPKLIIADGSNYYSYVSRWRRTCKQKKLPFHHTSEKGVFIIE